MNPFHALILGIIQGLTEFLPVSSSAHLIIFPVLFGWPEQPLVFDTTLHLGTATALLIYFRHDLIEVYSALLKDMFQKKVSFDVYTREAKFGFILLLSTIPATIIGFLFGDIVESAFRSIVGVIITLIFGTILLVVAEKFFSKNSAGNLLEKVSAKKGLLIGAFQSLAIFPGVSRSGATISAGMFFGLSREEAARFSFLASLPIILEAGVFQIVKNPAQFSAFPVAAVLIGFFASLLVGFVAIKFLLQLLTKHGLKVFIVYRILLVLFLTLLLLN